MPYQRRYLAAIAIRSEGVPHVTAYWLMSAWIAVHAASLSGCGIGKSGIPWARLSAPCSLAMLVISRIIDSVNVFVRRAVVMLQRCSGFAINATGRRKKKRGVRERTGRRAFFRAESYLLIVIVAQLTAATLVSITRSIASTVFRLRAAGMKKSGRKARMIAPPTRSATVTLKE